MQESLIKSPRFLRLECINRSSSKDLFSDLFDVVEFPKLTRHKFQSFMQTDLKKSFVIARSGNKLKQKISKNLKNLLLGSDASNSKSGVEHLSKKFFFLAKIVTEQVLNDSLMQHHFASVKISAKKLNMTTSSLEFLEGTQQRDTDLVASNR